MSCGPCVLLTDARDIAELGSLSLGLVTAVETRVGDDATSVGALDVAHPGLRATVEVYPIPAGDRLEPAWGNRLWRLVLTPQELTASGSWTVGFSRRQ